MRAALEGAAAGSVNSDRSPVVVTNNVVVRLVAGEAAGVVAVYARAVAQADRVRALLVAAELDLDAVLVVPSVSAAGQPVVYLTGLTGPARTRLDRILHRSTGPSPRDASSGMRDHPVNTEPTTQVQRGTGWEGRGA
ncbi:MAG: hypothetical protein ACRDRV_11450 [Pseudonocardiaceae bacterium]